MASFPQRKIGNTTVSAMGLGCMGMSIRASDATPNDDYLAVLSRAADLGITFWDTSDAYGDNEVLIAQWFQKNPHRRKEIFLATKFGVEHRTNLSAININGTPEYVKSACEKSLQRLGVDYIDLYYVHRIDSKTPIELTVGAMKELKDSGKIRNLGLSECSATTLRRACKIEHIAAAQMEFSPFAMEIEDEETNFLATARELGTTIVPYAPLGKGFLTGAIKSRSDMDPADVRLHHIPRFSAENFAQNFKVVEAIATIAREKGCTSGQLALAWVMAQGADFVPIPGTKKVKYLEENAGAVKVHVSKEDDAKIREAIARVGGTAGTRYSAALMTTCFGDTPELNVEK